MLSRARRPLGRVGRCLGIGKDHRREPVWHLPEQREGDVTAHRQATDHQLIDLEVRQQQIQIAARSRPAS